MKLVRFKYQNKTVIGKLLNNTVVDISHIFEGGSMRQLLTDWERYKDDIIHAETPCIPIDDVEILAPIDDPQKFLAIGMNYKKHAEEARDLGFPVPDTQLWFNKQVSCINGPYSDVESPPESAQLDYEAEMAVIIGKRCRRISIADAMSAVVGYAVANDVSARDWQMKSQTITLGKSFDTHGPIGPCITTADEVGDPHSLDISLSVNGGIRQHANTRDFIYSIPEMISYLSTVMTLEPGDILLTGTPSGVGIVSGKLLEIGDVVEVSIDKLGSINNTIVSG